jgi:acyl-coenzyme A thioesterase PaaI-like protein
LTSHHELCFGCGLANLFGLQMELSREGDRVVGRFFAKQDHQGPRGAVHAGIVTTALEDAIEILLGAEPRRIEVEFLEPAPIGTFLRVSATAVDESSATAELWSGDDLVARALAKRAAPG